MKKARYQRLNLDLRTYYGVLALVGAMLAVGMGAAWYMEHNGHWVTGMDNQVVWGLPHVFAVFMIVAASGALNVASLSSVFNRSAYKSLDRLSGLLAVTLLVGGLAVLVLDLGRPDRLIVAMTHFNFSSIFAWNVFLYTGFLGVVGIYVWFMMERRMACYKFPAALLAFVWRLGLTTGTGLIFGFIVAREAYDAAVMAPMFIAMSFAFGLAVFVLVLAAIGHGTDNPLGGYLVRRLAGLLILFIAAVQYFVIVQHLTNLYASEHTGVERFILLDGGPYTAIFWLGQVLIGGIAPLALLFWNKSSMTTARLSLASVLVILGGFAQIYVIIIGGQAYPLSLFPGMEVTSSFFDGVAHSYNPSLPEFLLGLGGIAIAASIALVAMRVMDFLPASLADKAIDPHKGNS